MLEILELHEAGCECAWLRFMVLHIHESYGFASNKETITVMFEINATCIAQTKSEFIKVTKIML